MQRPVRLGLIGCGGIVRISHAPGYQAIPNLVRVTALADPVSDNLQRMGEVLAVPPDRRYADHRQMLEHAELDAVTIATPHHMHAEHAMDAAAAGVAVISEKPMATSIEQAQEVLAAVQRHGVPYAVVHNFLFAQGTERARALLAEGAAGTPFFGRAKSLFNKTDDRADPNREWRASRAAGGGAINDTAYHEIYLLETLVGSPVRYVEARVATQHFDFDVDDLALLLLEHDNGALSTVATSWCVPGGGGAGRRRRRERQPGRGARPGRRRARHAPRARAVAVRAQHRAVAGGGAAAAADLGGERPRGLLRRHLRRPGARRPAADRRRTGPAQPAHRRRRPPRHRRAARRGPAGRHGRLTPHHGERNPMRPYIDCHNHIGRTLNRLPPTGQSTAMCLARFAETSVYACLSMPTATGGLILRGLEDIRDQNRVIARARRDFPEHVPLGLALVEPCLGQVAVDEAEWAMSELGLHGIVSHPPVREACIPFVEMAAARGGLCNVHMHDALFGEIARMFPGATFITHASSHAAEHFAGMDNVWFEVVQYPDERGSRWDFARLADRVGRERIIFGADLPYYDYRLLQQIIEQAPIDDDLKDRIAYRNILELIRQYNPEWQLPDGPPQSPRVSQPDELWAVDPEKPDRLTVYG